MWCAYLLLARPMVRTAPGKYCRPTSWPYQQKISVRNVASCIEALLPRPRTQRQEEATHKLTSIVFNESNDMMLWKLNTTRIYSAKSFYDFYAGLGKIMWEFHALWRAKAPHRFESSIFLCCTTSCSRNRSCKRGKLQTYQAASCVGSVLRNQSYTFFTYARSRFQFGIH
jgi:hypothetical protein